MVGPLKFGIQDDFFFTKNDCYELNLPTLFESLRADSWLNEKEVALKIVESSAGSVKDFDVALKWLYNGLNQIKDSEFVSDAMKKFAKFVRTHYDHSTTKAVLNSYLSSALEEYLAKQARELAEIKLLRENYKIHGALASTSASNIIKAATKEAEGYESDSSAKSKDCHPRRTTKYVVNAASGSHATDNDSKVVKELREFRERSVVLAEDNANQLSDLRLLSLDCVYLFAEDIEKSATKYLGTDVHNSLVPSLSCGRCEDVDPVAFVWCMKLANFQFKNGNDKWMEIQEATIGILAEAMATRNKSLVQIANMLHTVAPRLFASSSAMSNVEDTYIHHLVSYVIKLTFGIEDILQHQWANSRLNQENESDKGKFKPDYIAFVKTRSVQHDVVIAEVKPPGSCSGKPPSDLVKLGQQMKVMINNLVDYKVVDPVVCGILVEGRICSLYKMDMVATHFYRMVLLASFPICTTKAELCLVPNVYMWMTKLKNIAVQTAKKVEERELAEAKGKRKIEEVIPTSWIDRGTCTFSKVKKTGK